MLIGLNSTFQDPGKSVGQNSLHHPQVPTLSIQVSTTSQAVIINDYFLHTQSL